MCRRTPRHGTARGHAGAHTTSRLAPRHWPRLPKGTLSPLLFPRSFHLLDSETFQTPEQTGDTALISMNKAREIICGQQP